MSPRNTQSQIQRVAFKIMDYLRENPSAKDSCRGIASCWIGEEFDVVERALFFLVGSGLVARETRHGTAFYRLNNQSSSGRRTKGDNQRTHAGGQG